MSENCEVSAYHREAVERVIREMYARYYEPMSLRDMAEIARFSPYHFHRIFSSMTGVPPARFLAAIRIDTAKRLLLTEEISITEICMSVGYSSLGTFSSRFHESVGISPSELRRLAQNETLTCAAAASLQDGLPQSRLDAPPSVEGEIQGCSIRGNTTFVGLFCTASPERMPQGCAIPSASGMFSIPPVGKGEYRLLGVSLHISDHPLSLLLPNRSSVLVASLPYPLRVTGTTLRVRLPLRPAEITDPPLLTALPALLARRRSIPVDERERQEQIA